MPSNVPPDPCNPLESPINLTIGVLATETQRQAAAEFFELFKIPWSPCDEQAGNRFPAVIATAGCHPRGCCAPLLVCFGPDETPLDAALGLVRSALPAGVELTYRDRQFPIRTRCVAFDSDPGHHRISTNGGQAVGVIAQHGSVTIVRVGFDLFDEVQYLLSSGQTPADAGTPAIEILISIVRDSLLEHGIPVVELPPNPPGHPFIACLTHDIDFIGIRQHKLDHTFLGFVYRVFKSAVHGRTRDWSKVRKNFLALFSLPAVYLKLLPDFWYPVDRYEAIEHGHPSTYFFIPFAGRAGRQATARRAFRRAAPYDVKEYAQALRSLEAGGSEVAVHGIDAWCDPASAAAEMQVIRDITGKSAVGIRMHWLYFSEHSPDTLDRAGYIYDSTLGYNDAVGYRNGTTQIFRPPGARRLLEIPLTVQDTALFFPDRMNLTEPEAFDTCRKILDDLERFGGVLTVNWHDRSLAPERNWDTFYARFLKEIEAFNPWFAQARMAVAWFQRRRETTFSRVTFSSSRVVVQFANPAAPLEGLPPLTLRVHRPASAHDTSAPSVFDIPLNGEPSLAFDLSR